MTRLKVRMTEEDLKEVTEIGRWMVCCPHCSCCTPVEADADVVECEECERDFQIINPYI